MINRLYLLVLFAMLSDSASAQSNLTCATYKTGTFKMIEARTNSNFRIERTANKQTEFDMNKGTYIVYSVSWISDCEYELKFIEGNSEAAGFFKTRPVIVKIIEVYADGYKFEGHIKGTREYKTFYMRTV